MKLKFQNLIFMLLATVFTLSLAGKELKFGTIPDVGAGNVTDKYGVLLKHIEKQTGYKIKIIPIQSYAALVLAMKRKQVDFAYMGPKGFIDASKRNKAKPLALELNLQGQPGYKSIIIVRSNSKYKKIQDLKRKKFAFVDPNSTSGGVIPSMYFAEIGIKPKKFFSRVLYTGSHEAAVISIKTKKVDGAVTNDLDLQEIIKAGRVFQKDVRVIWTSDLIPGSVYVASGHINRKTREKLQKALISFKDKKTFEKMAISGLAIAKNSDYDALRLIIKEKNKRKK